ncbi:YkvA family protein [Parageobacillus thermoglucosidasius]|uniref:YkvA family protein n=1 Tax=Parageobacillus thermoglucosidasius TaxID=1426 RepID=UPI0001D181F7|nr:DUF1232 domain-containing protein [Parageobacillus thermoglucosidasius]AEH49681.1 protein of unknown function DUF1232 [Parageobacillus thermoglucosidasius C56-YS93]RDE35513.1 DUF1232 domain-containing protein [Parageobacillus thermoglucosidasius]
MQTWKRRAKELKRELFVLYLAYKDPRISWLLRLFTLCAVAYAFSPVDLIPDFAPVFGYLDDLLLVPLGIFLALKWMPKEVIDEYRAQAAELAKKEKPKNWLVGGLIIVLYVALFVWLFPFFAERFID